MQEEVAENQEAPLAEEPMEERVEQETLAEAEAMEDVDDEGLVTAEELLNSPEHSAAANLEINLDYYSFIPSCCLVVKLTGL